MAETLKEKLCRKCDVAQPQVEFAKYSHECKGCKALRESERYFANKRPHRDRHLRRTYGISLDQYEEMEARQDGKCAICTGPSDGESFNVDHNHVTGAVRSLLCAACNKGLGHFQDDADLLLAAAQYLIQAEAFSNG